MNKLAKAGIIVIAIMIPVYLAFTLMISSQSYLTISEVISGGYEGKNVSVLGTVVNGSMTFMGNQLIFNITDRSKLLVVHYKGSMNLSDQDEVVVKGTYTEGVGIEAQQILTGCASAYGGPQSSIFQDPIILCGSIIIIAIFTALFLLELIRKKHA